MTSLSRRLFSVLLVAFSSVLVGCISGSFSPHQTTLTADKVNLPTKKEHGQLWIEARINGAGPFLLLVDTGCTVMLLPQRVADAAGLKVLPKWEMKAVNAAGVVSKEKAALIESFDCGGLQLKNFFTGVKSDEDFAAIS